ncbi:hypothetical protein H6F75_09855 [Nodosilinea sp. FACHB-131]|uniref:hypothetical protein n=1 Tax=Cyanophyceae TaxID=3028117 RepID=UPI00168391D2|nr:hypothetical protein [Nodosilinea sp. FACHB-131]MBD1873787.1 hypothetical protein [Nodosilinea sp. FACHB-131]
MPTPPQPTWQTTLNPGLVQRLMRPVTQPGVIGSELTEQIQARAERWANRLPLLTTLDQRHLPAAGTYPQTPIVYAQALPPEDNAAVPKQTSISPAAKTDHPMVIQAKFAPGAPANRGASMAPAPQPLPDLPQVQPRAVAGLSRLDAGPGASGDQSPRLNAGWPDLAVQSVRSVGEVQPTPVPLSTPFSGAAIGPPPLPSPLGQMLPIVTANSIVRPSERADLRVTSPFLLGESQDLSISAEGPLAISPTQQRSHQERSLTDHASALSARSQAIPTAKLPGPKAKSADPTVEQPPSLPRVRSLAPKTDWGQPPPPVLAPLAVVSPIQSMPTGSWEIANPHGEARTLPGGGPVGPTAGPESPLPGPSIVRDIRGGSLAAPAAVPPVPAVLPVPTVVSHAPSPPLDVEALADQVERKLARRLAIERERRGWRS